MRLHTPPHWQPGDAVALRGVWRGILWFAQPVTVVRDDPDLIALCWRAGAREKNPGRRLTPQDMLSMAQPELVDGTWVRTDVLMLAEPGVAHSVWAVWEAGHTRFRCWYVNLEDPLRRSPMGFDSRDHLLDIVISPDRREWHWKDEAEFAEAQAAGLYSAAQAAAIRAEGARVIALAQAGQPPFCDGWERWAPPPEWEMPVLPPGWDRIAAG